MACRECKDVASCYQCRMVCLPAGHNCEPCKNGQTNGDAVWVVHSGGPKESLVRWGPGSPHGKGDFRELFPPIHMHCISKIYIYILEQPHIIPV